MIDFQSQNLIFEKLSRKHLSDSYVGWLNDSEINKFLESGNNYDIEKLNEFLIKQENKEILFWAIIIKKNKKHIGNIKIDPIKNGVGDYGILIGDKNYWGKGVAYEASRAVIDYCFNKLELKKITLGVYEDHIGAIKLYEKLGFKKYDTLKSENSKRDVNSVKMEILNDE